MWFPTHLGTWLESHEIKKNSVVTGIEPTTSGLLDERRSRSDYQAPVSSGFLRPTVFFDFVVPTLKIKVWSWCDVGVSKIF